MNAQVQPPLLLQAIAAENLIKTRAILANTAETGMSAEHAALSVWWDSMKIHQRRGLLMLAGVNNTDRGRQQWEKLPVPARAAVVLLADNLRHGLNGVASVLRDVRESARAEIKRFHAEQRKIEREQEKREREKELKPGSHAGFSRNRKEAA